jgi:hypothetical protein
VNPRDRTLFVAALGLAVVAFAAGLLDYLSWPFAGPLLALSLGAAVWLRRRATAAAEKPPVQQVESGLRIVEKPLAAGRPRLPHGLRVTVSTEVAVSLGLRVVCDTLVPEVEALAQTGRGSAARQGVPATVRESRQAWLFVVRNSPGERELFLRVDLFAAQPIHVQRVEQIRPGAGAKVTLPEWRELGSSLAAPSEAPAAANVAAASRADAPASAPTGDPHP